LSDQKAKLFMDRLEYYIRHPEDVVVWSWIKNPYCCFSILHSWMMSQK
jgi:hypothetical protein